MILTYDIFVFFADCFEHASHVAASIFRMVSFDVEDEDKVLALRDHARAIAGDPLTQFSCDFSAVSFLEF